MVRRYVEEVSFLAMELRSSSAHVMCWLIRALSARRRMQLVLRAKALRMALFLKALRIGGGGGGKPGAGEWSCGGSAAKLGEELYSLLRVV